MKILDFVRTKLAFNPKLELKDFDWRATDIGIENTAKLQLCNFFFDVLLTQKIVIIIIEKNRSELFNQR